MSIEQEILNIKKELRASMNGILSARMRQAGMPYKLVFGVELPRLQNIASEFTPSRQLAQNLWNENIRETRILACLLMPAKEFIPEIADIWGNETPTAEIAQIMATHLMPYAPRACDVSFEWIASDKEMKQLCGFLCVARLLQQGADIEDRSLEELENQGLSLMNSASPTLKRAITAALHWKREYEEQKKSVKK